MNTVQLWFFLSYPLVWFIHQPLNNVSNLYKHFLIVEYSSNTCMQMGTEVQREHAVLPVCFLPGSWCSVWPGWASLRSGVAPEESPFEACHCTGSQPPAADTNKPDIAPRRLERDHDGAMECFYPSKLTTETEWQCSWFDRRRQSIEQP